MATQKLSLTRDQLASFLQDFEQIKQFERLFAVADQVAPSADTTGISIEAGIANATANDALAQIIRLAQDTAVNSDNKGVQALDSFARISNTVEMMALAPIHNNVELSHDVNGILPYANQTARVRSNQVLTWLSM
jgi:hypothetical protein